MRAKNELLSTQLKCEKEITQKASEAAEVHTEALKAAQAATLMYQTQVLQGKKDVRKLMSMLLFKRLENQQLLAINSCPRCDQKTFRFLRERVSKVQAAQSMLEDSQEQVDSIEDTIEILLSRVDRLEASQECDRYFARRSEELHYKWLSDLRESFLPKIKRSGRTSSQTNGSGTIYGPTIKRLMEIFADANLML